MTDDIAVPRNTRRTVIIAAGVLLAVNLGVVGVLATKTNTVNPTLPTGLIDVAVCDQVVRPQQVLRVQLATDYDGDLLLDGNIALPHDEYELRSLDSNALSWQPGPNHAIRELTPGLHTLTVRYHATKGVDSGKTAVFTCRFKVG